VFGESSTRDRVFFVESVAGKESVVQNVFVNSVQHQRHGVMTSQRGHAENAPNGDRFLVLESGRRHEGTPGDAEYRVMEFERYAMRIEAREGLPPESSPKNLTTRVLLADPSPGNRGELVWRVGVPILALVLALLAIPMGFVNPRAGRSINLLFALLAYMVYSNLLSVSQARVAQGRLEFGIGLWLVHAVMVAVLVLMFAHRMQLYRMLRRR
jgi:lipopolysaccharide export system permease protein